MSYRARPARTASGAPQIPYEALRLGLYDPRARRFVPLTDPVPSALGGLLDPERARAFVLAGDLVMGEIWLVQARRLDVALFDLTRAVDAKGHAVLHADDVDVRDPKTNRNRVAVEASLERDDAVRVTLHQLGYDPKGTLVLRITSEGVTTTADPLATDSASVIVSASGVFVERPPPAGLVLERDRLIVRDPDQPERTFALPRGHDEGHHQVVRTDDGRFIMVFTQQAGCREVAFARYVLDRIDVREGTVTRLSAAPVHAGVELGPDGSVYLDDGERVLRFPPTSAKPIDDVLEGVRFVMPDFDRDCSI